MTRISPVPQDHNTTDTCTQYYEDGREINDEIQGQIMSIEKMEEITGKKFGDKENRFLYQFVQVPKSRCVHDTILNLGLNETVVETIAAKSGKSTLGLDCYRRFIQMYSDVVMKLVKVLEELIDEMKAKKCADLEACLLAIDVTDLEDARDLSPHGVYLLIEEVVGAVPGDVLVPT